MQSPPVNDEAADSGTETETARRISLPAAAIGLLILLHAGFGLHTALSKNVTHDELWHLPVGLLHLQSGEFDQDVLNPPLSRMWAALPLSISGVTTERGADGSECGIIFVNQHADFQHWYNWGRVFHLAWSVVTACLVARWTWELFGRSAAVLATLLYCTCPNVIAHTSIVTPDASLMCLWIATLYALWRWTKTESWSTALTTAVLMGLALSAKFTAVLLYPIMLYCWFLRFVGSSRMESNLSRSMLVLQSAVSVLLSLTVLCAVYGFNGVGVPLEEQSFRSREVQSIATLLSFADNVPLPVPSDWLLGVDAQRMVMEQRHPVFLDRQWSEGAFATITP